MLITNYCFSATSTKKVAKNLPTGCFLLEECRSRDGAEGLRYTCSMIRQIAPQFFTTNIPGTVAYYKDKLGFECLGTWQDPPVYAILARDQHAIHFRCAAPPTANPDKYADEQIGRAHV